MLKNTSFTYGSVAKFFHWLIVFFVILMLFLGYFMEDISDKVLRGVVVNAHKLLGITILALMILRGLWALMNTKPALPMGTPAWQRAADYLVQGLLYFSLIAMPLVGWIGSSSAGKPPRWGDVVLGLPILKREWLIDVSFALHNFLAVAIIVLICIHVLAALFHHFIRKDNILLRMLPDRNA